MSEVTDESAARLYGPPLAETLYFTIEEAWEVTDGDEVVEHTVHPPRYHLPAADTVGEWLAEWAAENGELDEYGSDDIANACLNPVALAAIEACLETIATQVTYRMADKEVATHRRPPLTASSEAHDGPCEIEGCRICSAVFGPNAEAKVSARSEGSD